MRTRNPNESGWWSFCGGLPIPILIALAPGMVFAEGVVEINQACAVGGGCVEGDAPGFPVTLAAPGSYRLTGDLAVPSANLDGILINASHVQLDLGGFAIVGPVVCATVGSSSGTSLSCSPASGSGTGVDVGPVVDVAVVNGRVRGMGFRGVNLGDHSRIAGLVVESNASTGITVGDASLVSDVSVLRNGSIGLVADPGSIVVDATARSNFSIGIRVFEGVNLSRCTSELNGSDGILAGSGASISDCTLLLNASDGIQTSPRTSIMRNSVHQNEGFGVNNLSTTATAAIRNNMLSDTNTLGNADNVLNLGGNYCGPFVPTTTCE